MTRRVLKWGGPLLGVLAAMPAWAQEAPAPTPPDEIVVTAQGRAERPADVPLSVQSFGPAAIRDLGVRDIRELSAFVPGLVVETQYPTTPAIVIRGISTDTADVTAEPRIAVYRDGVYVARPQAALFELFDLERVEVIKGPQSTMFGRGALTGAISIVQRKADPTGLGARLTVGAGDLQDHLVEGMVNVPLSAGTAVRLAGISRDEDGYVENLAGGPRLNGNRVEALRGSFHADLPGGGGVDLIGNAQRDRFTGLSYKSGTFAPSDPATGRALGDLSPYSAAYVAAAPDFPRGGIGGSRDLAEATLLVDRPLGGGFSLSGIGAWTHFRTEFVGDEDGASPSVATAGEITRGRQWSGELRLHYDRGSALSAILGASIANEHGSQDILTELDEREVLALQTGFLDRTSPTLLPEAAYRDGRAVAGQLLGLAQAYGVALPPAEAAAIAANLSGSHLEQLIRTNRSSYAEAFANVLLEPAPRVAIEAGLRYTHAAKTSGLATSVPQRSVLAGFLGALAQPAPVRDALLAALSAPGAAAIPVSASFPVPQFGLLYQATAAGEERARDDDGGLSGRLSLRYAAAPALNLYATYARGRRPEVLAPEPPLAPGAPARFDPLAAETVDSLEVGAKLTPSAALEVDGALFGYRYRHFQTELLQGTTLVSVDAGRASAWGGELSARDRVTPHLQLFATYGYTHARFGSGLYRGNRFRLSPDHALSGGLTATHDLAGGTISLTPSIDWRSRTYLDNSNGDLTKLAGAFLTPLPFQASQGPYARANLNLGYARAHWRIDAFLANLADRRYLRDIGTGSVAFGIPSYVAAPPRSVRVALTVATGKSG